MSTAPRDRPISCSLFPAMQAPCWCTRTMDVSIICTANSWLAVDAFMIRSQTPALRPAVHRGDETRPISRWPSWWGAMVSSLVRVVRALSGRPLCNWCTRLARRSGRLQRATDPAAFLSLGSSKEKRVFGKISQAGERAQAHLLFVTGVIPLFTLPDQSRSIARVDPVVSFHAGSRDAPTSSAAKSRNG